MAINKKISEAGKEFIEAAAQKHYDEIYIFICRRCGNEDDAKDICQNAFIKFARSVNTYREKGNMRAYLFKIAINCCNDYYRQTKASLPLDALPNSAENYTKDPQQTVEADGEGRKVTSILSSLPQNQKDVLILRYYHNMKPREIASCLSLPVTTIKTRLGRAKKSFAKEWENDR